MTPEEIEKLNEEVKENIRELRGLLKDSHEHVKNLIELNAYTRELAEREVYDTLMPEVKKQLELIGPECQKILDAMLKRTVEQYDKFVDILMGTTKSDARKGRPSVPDLITQYALHQKPGQMYFPGRIPPNKKGKK